MGEYLDKEGLTRFKEKMLTEVDERIASSGGEISLDGFMKTDGSTLMTGTIKSSAKNTVMADNDDEWVTVGGGTDPTKGAYLRLRSNGGAHNGDWQITSVSYDGTEYTLSGNAEGDLYWGNNEVITDEGGQLYGSLLFGYGSVVGIDNGLSVKGEYEDWGAHLDLFDYGHSTNAGGFELVADNGQGVSCKLEGKTDGTLTWGGKNFVRSVNGILPNTDGDVSVSGMPIGAIITYASTSPPSGYLLCNGSAVSRTTYSELFAVIGTSHGEGDGSTTFNLPNLPASIGGIGSWNDLKENKSTLIVNIIKAK